jgi:putative flippase GtrA
MLEQRLGTAVGEFARFAVVGVLSNLALFLLYLVITHLGVGHKFAASLVYAIGVMQTFVFNRTWSFRDRGAAAPALRRYIAVYGAGYVLNMIVLTALVDHAGYPHQWVQGTMIIVLAVLLFAAQKLWVFRDQGNR